jgi:hypothetical protein
MGGCEFYVLYTVHFNIIMPHKPTKRTFSKVISQFLILMSSIFFESDALSPGRRLFRKVDYIGLYCNNCITLQGA